MGGRWVATYPACPGAFAMPLTIPDDLLAEAGLSYLGLGTQPPHASWGRMLYEAQTFMEISPWMAVFPGLAIAWAVLGFNLLGDGLRDTLDPKMVRAI